MIARATKERTNELIVGVMRAWDVKNRPANIVDRVDQARNHVRSLEYDAYLAHLDGKKMRAYELRREAGRLSRVLARAERGGLIAARVA